MSELVAILFDETLCRCSRSLILAVLLAIGLASPALADLGAAKSFAVLSSGSSVTVGNRVKVTNTPIPQAVTCPGAAGCPVDFGGTTILMGRGNGAAPNQINANVIAGATASQGINCAGATPGTTAICLGYDSEVTGACITGGGAISSPGKCAGGTDTSTTNPRLTTVLHDAASDLATFSAVMAALAPTKTLPAINLRVRGSITIVTSSGLNVISVPFIATGANATVTISARSQDFVVINVGTSSAPGRLIVGIGSSVLLTGGITPDRVVFNVRGAGGPALLGTTTIFNGVIVAPEQELTLSNGDTPQPIVVNGALLAGPSISIGNNVNINFYPLAQIARQVTVRKGRTVNVQNLPPPHRGNRIRSVPFQTPIIDEVPGSPGTPVASSRISIAGLAQAQTAPLAGMLPRTPAPTNQVSPDPVLRQLLGFPGVNSAEARGDPPDTQLAAGRTRLVEMANTAVAFFGKFGRLQSIADLDDFFGVPSGHGFDPRVLYDAPSGTFFACYTEDDAPHISLGVAADPGDDWTFYDYFGHDPNVFFDYPSLGISDDKIIVSWNVGPIGAERGAKPKLGVQYAVFQKSGLLNGADSVPGVVWGPDTTRSIVVPVQSLSTDGGVHYAAYHQGRNFHVMAFTGVPGVSDVGFTEIAIGIGSVQQPPLALQPSGGGGIDTGDSRVLSAVWQNNRMWAVFPEGCTPEGDDTTRACLRFVRIGTPPAELGGCFFCLLLAAFPAFQNVQLSFPKGYIYYPALTLNANDDLFFGFTASSSDLLPTAVAAGTPGGIFGSETGGIFYQSGSQPVPDDCFDPNNPFAGCGVAWGDYSGIAREPNDPSLVWLAQEFGGIAGGKWGTAIAGVVFTAPPPPPPR